MRPLPEPQSARPRPGRHSRQLLPDGNDHGGRRENCPGKVCGDDDASGDTLTNYQSESDVHVDEPSFYHDNSYKANDNLSRTLNSDIDSDVASEGNWFGDVAGSSVSHHVHADALSSEIPDLFDDEDLS